MMLILCKKTEKRIDSGEFYIKAWNYENKKRKRFRMLISPFLVGLFIKLKKLTEISAVLILYNLNINVS